MPKKQNGSGSGQKNRNPRASNDQLGENAGEGRLMKENEKKQKKK